MAARLGATPSSRVGGGPKCIKPVVGTDSCQVEHIGYCLSGGIHVTHEDGTESDVVAGEVYRILPGHDA